MKRFRLSFAAVFISITLLMLAVGQAASMQEQGERYPRDTGVEDQILGELNRWRIRIGLDPLARNADLDFLAMEQARYMAPRIPFLGETEFHLDQYGYGIVGRARLFGWPGYDIPSRLVISEIAAYFPDVAGSINFWQTSRIHNAAVTTAGFREAGVAVLRHRNWILTYVVMGGRPNVLPVTYDAGRNVLFLSRDRSLYGDNFRPTRVRILNEFGERVHEQEWLVWSNRLLLPRGASGTITVIQTDGIRESRWTLNLYDSRVFPADPTPTPSNTPQPTRTPTPVLATATPTIPLPTPTPTATPVNGAFDVQMVYNDQSFSLINTSGRDLDLSPLIIVSNELGVSLTSDWLGRYFNGSMSEFPPRYCLQTWSFEMFPGPPRLPEGCVGLASGRSSLRAGERFWLAGEFDIIYRRQLVARCTADTGRCAFDMP